MEIETKILEAIFAQRRINEIDGLIRGYRAAVNLIIKEERALLKEKESLKEVEGLGK